MLFWEQNHLVAQNRNNDNILNSEQIEFVHLTNSKGPVKVLKLLLPETLFNCTREVQGLRLFLATP